MGKFKVKRGKKFFMGPRWNFFGRYKKEFGARTYFWINCTYKLTKNYDQVNKLTGWSYNIFPWYDKSSKKFRSGHHKNSVRFGWRCVDGEQIELIAYAYIDGIRKQRSLMFVEVDSWINLGFKETDSYYTFKAIAEDGESSVVRFKKSSDKKGFLGLFIHRLYPYFGGRIPAPHNMTIEIKHLKKLI